MGTFASFYGDTTVPIRKLRREAPRIYTEGNAVRTSNLVPMKVSIGETTAHG